MSENFKICGVLRLVFRMLTVLAPVGSIAGPATYMTSDPLAIAIQPSDQVNCKGNKVTFAVAAIGGEGKIHFSWLRKRPGEPGFSSFGAKDSTKLPVAAVGGAESPDGTLYKVVLSDLSASITSREAVLTVNQVTGISPVGTATFTVREGENLSFRVLTAGRAPVSWQWIRRAGTNDWRSLTDNQIRTGCQSDQLLFNGITPADTGTYKVRITFPTTATGQCTETSTVSRKILVVAARDTEPPTFLQTGNEIIPFCPDQLIDAEWSDPASALVATGGGNHVIPAHCNKYDLSPALFRDNQTDTSGLILHWGIFQPGNNSIAITDMNGIRLDNQTGQVSGYPVSIPLGDQDDNTEYEIVYWLEDKAGNLTPDSARYRKILRLVSLPALTGNF